MEDKQKKSISFLDLAGIAGAIILIILHCVMTYRHGVKFINSDQSAELMLGKLLSCEHKILSGDWYYSTELRVFSMNLIYSFAWIFAKSYTGVMVLSQGISLILLYVSQTYFYKKMGSRLSFVYPLILMVPFSCEYYIIVIFGLHYIPHIVITFFTLGMFAKVLETKEEKKLSWDVCGIFVLCAILGLLEGMGGMRMLIVLYLPLFMASVFVSLFEEKDYQVLKWKKTTILNLAFSCVNLFAAFAGYVVNSKILQKHYNFQSWGDLTFNNVKVDVLWRAVADYTRLFGFEGGKVFSFKGITCMLSVIMLAFLIYAIVKACLAWKEWNLIRRIVISFGLFANACILAIFVFSDIYYESRYYIPAICALWPVVFLWLERDSREEQSFVRMAKPIICALIVLAGMCLLCTTYKTMVEKDSTINDRTVTEYLLEEGYEYGFATFWHANIMNQISEDKLTVCPIENLNQVNRYKWLTSKQILEPEWDGAVFLVIEDIEHEIYQYNDLLSNTDRIVYARDGMWVYSFGSYEEFAQYMSE